MKRSYCGGTIIALRNKKEIYRERRRLKVLFSATFLIQPIDERGRLLFRRTLFSNDKVETIPFDFVLIA